MNINFFVNILIFSCILYLSLVAYEFYIIRKHVNTCYVEKSCEERCGSLKNYTNELNKTEEKRNYVFVVWATKDYVESSYSVIFGMRVIGEWKYDIIVLGDYFTATQKKALACLNAKAVTFNHEQLKLSIPEANDNVMFLKLAIWLDETIRTYEVVQYIDLDTVIVGKLPVIHKKDFPKDVVVLMEDNGLDPSFIKREMFSFHSDQDKNDFLKIFPGADQPTNGPNHSKSACAGRMAILPSRLPPIVTLRDKIFSPIVTMYTKFYRAGDQPTIMLSFWGKWRQIDFGGVWMPKANSLLKKETTFSYIHTGGDSAPSKQSSTYYQQQSTLLVYASIILKCPYLLV